MARESLEKKRQRMTEIVAILKKEYPDSKCSLFFKSPFQLLISTILSAQCTDERVNQVTPPLFDRWPDPESMSAAKISEIEKMIHSTGFYKNKALSLKMTSTVLHEQYRGVVPETMEALVQLRGIGRKTANVVLGTAFGKQAGVVVDTHVGRINRRLGMTTQKDPVKVEKDLVGLLPRADWTNYSHLMIDHGRLVCTARRAHCNECKLARKCPKKGV